MMYLRRCAVGCKERERRVHEEKEKRERDGEKPLGVTVNRNLTC